MTVTDLVHSALHVDELDLHAVALLEECAVAALLGEVDTSLRARARTSARLVAGLLAADAPVLAAAARRAEVELAGDDAVTADLGAALARIAHGALGVLAGEAPAAGTLATVDVLVVQEDPRSALAAALRRTGLDVHVLQDGPTALSCLATGLRPRVLVVDADLPGLDGMSLLRRLRAAGTLDGVRVLMVSARSADTEVMEAFALGADDHVALPYSLPVLVQRVRRLLPR